MTARLFDKVWDRHVVASPEGEPALLFIDLHLVHEVTSPQAFEGLELAGRKVRRPDLTLATMDHDVPTIGLDKPIADPLAAEQIERLKRNCAEHGVTLHALGSIEQGIVHVIGPQLGLTQPGMTIVCGDSHTSTHGAFGALAFGIGTSEVEHVLATQTLRQVKPKAMAVTVDGELPPECTAKDLVLGDHPRARRGRRGRLGHRVPRRGHPQAVDGRPDDGLQHVHRGRRAGWHDRAGRHDDRLPGRPQAFPSRPGMGTGGRGLAVARHRRGRRVRPGDHHRRGRGPPGDHLGHEPGPVGVDRRRHPGAVGPAAASRPGKPPSGR